jgi:hypothetical protein
VVKLSLPTPKLSPERKSLIKRIAKNVIKATAFGILFYFITKTILSMVSTFPSSFVPQQLMNNFTFFLQAELVLIVASELASGTILDPAFTFAKALAPLVVTLSSIQYATITISMESAEAAIAISVNLQQVLTVFVILELINIARATMNVASFVIRKVK